MSTLRAYTPIEGLVAIIARNRIIRLAFVTPRCFRRPEDDKGSPRGISSERFAASVGRGGGRPGNRAVSRAFDGGLFK